MKKIEDKRIDEDRRIEMIIFMKKSIIKKYLLKLNKEDINEIMKYDMKSFIYYRSFAMLSSDKNNIKLFQNFNKYIKNYIRNKKLERIYEI